MEQELQRIQEKLQKLIQQHQTLKKDNDRLLAENADLKENAKKQLELTIALERQLEASKVNAVIKDPASKKEMEKKLSQYIREIDRCIAILAD
ncbi:MAG: hypothetical protein RL732_797 [Bacteroidota bacterium]|jgi:CHASE3 domain sensor protein